MKKFAFSLISFILLLGLLFSCSSDNNDSMQNETHAGSILKSLDADKIIYKKLKQENFPNLATVKEELLRLKSSIDTTSIAGLFIEDEVALYAEYEGKHTYTFRTSRADSKKDEIENIVLESRADGKYNSYYFKYYFTNEEVRTLDRLSTETIKSKTEVIPFVIGNGGGLVNITCFEAVQNYAGRWECEAGNPHGPGHPDCQVGGSQWVIRPTTLSYIYVGCDDGSTSPGSGGPGGGSGSGGGPGGPGDESTPGNGSGSGGDNSGGEQSDPNHSFVQGQTIVTQPIQIDVEILQIIIDESFTENDCLNGVYQQLGGSPTFQNYLQNFDGDFSVANLKLSAGQIPGYPYGFAYTFPPYLDNLIEIRINDDKLNRPALDIARTLIHEMLHAEIFRKLLIAAETGDLNIDNWSQEEVVNYVNNLKDNFNELYIYYKKYQWDLPQDAQLTSVQHELLADSYRNIIIDVMKEFDNSHPDELYEALSWEGLMGEGDPENISSETGLPEYPTQAWIQKTVQERLNILSMINNFKSSVSACQ